MEYSSRNSMNLKIVAFIVLAFLFVNAKTEAQNAYKSMVISTGRDANAVELKIAGLLKDRLIEQGDVSVRIDKKTSANNNNELLIYLGRPDHHHGLDSLFEAYRIPKLSGLAPGPEGFLLQRIENNGLIVAGIDDRGCLYAVGELLRQISMRNDLLTIPEKLNIRTAPAFEIRGTQYGQSHVAKSLAKVRDWTEEETKRVILDYALAGANVFSTKGGPIYDFIKSYGLMTQGGFGANTAPEIKTPEWLGSESIGRTGYVCLSVPEARRYMLDKCEKFVKDNPPFDFIKFQGGDGGGCECDRCKPYGLTFITLVEEMANVIHKYYPETKVYFTNQKFDNADDNAIFSYLQEKPRDWLWAWGYGPGSDATSWQPGHRQTHRMDLFRYPGFGPYGLYPEEILHQLPPQQKLVYYNEITHWKYAQHAYIQMYPRADRNGDLPPHWGHDIYERRPDQYLTMVYNRLTFYAWPR